MIDQHNEPASAKSVPHPNNVSSNPRHNPTPNTPSISEVILIFVNLSSKIKWAKKASHSGFVNNRIDDIEEDTPNAIAKFNNPIVPAVCKNPITNTNINPL